jgi:hypothetical protein
MYSGSVKTVLIFSIIKIMYPYNRKLGILKTRKEEIIIHNFTAWNTHC